METIGRNGSKTEVVMTKKKKGEYKSTTGIGASLTPDYREKEESNNFSGFFWGVGKYASSSLVRIDPHKSIDRWWISSLPKE